jgi:hypothetical protein
MRVFSLASSTGKPGSWRVYGEKERRENMKGKVDSQEEQK